MNLQQLKEEQVALIIYWRKSVADWGTYVDLGAYKTKDLEEYQDKVDALHLSIVRLLALKRVE